jgi:hypothetical protein
MTINLLKNNKNNNLLSSSFNKKQMFSTTPHCRIDDGSGALMVAQHAAMTPMHHMAIIFVSFTLTVGAFLARSLQRSAVEAQHIEMYPEDLEDPFFAVPEYVMGELYRYIERVNQALDFWLDLDNLLDLNHHQALEFRLLLYQVKDMITEVRQFFDFIVDLDDTHVNAHLEFLQRNIRSLDLILEKIASLQDTLVVVNFYDMMVP